MFANLSLHLHRLSSRHAIRREHLDTARIERTLGFFVKSLPVLLRAERCNVLVYDPEARTAWLEVGTGLVAGAFAVPTQSTVVGEVIASGRSRIANDLGGDAACGGDGLAVRNAAYAPIWSRFHGEVIGVVEALDKVDAPGFEPADLRTLEEAAEIVQDLVDSVFLAQHVYGASDAVLRGGVLTATTVGSLVALGSLLTLLLMAAWSSLPLMSDALNPTLLPILPGTR